LVGHGRFVAWSIVARLRWGQALPAYACDGVTIQLRDGMRIVLIDWVVLCFRAAGRGGVPDVPV
jgi:hypothetical protein